MRLRRGARASVLLVGLGIFTAVALSAQAAVAAPIRANPVLGSGSGTTYNMMVALDSLYNNTPGCQVIAAVGQTQPLDFSCILPDPTGTIKTENYEHDQVTEAFALGSSNGITQLCDQGLVGVAKINFARSSRALKTTDCTGLHFVAYAKDAIPWEAFPNLPGSPVATMNNPDPLCAGKGLCLTQAQIVGIFVTCTITDWSQVGGTAAPIEVFTAQAGSGTRATFEGFIGGVSDACIPAADLTSHTIFENENTSLFANAHNAANAIFYFSFGDWEKNILPNPDGSALGAIDGIVPSISTIQDSSFPYSRFLYNVYCFSCATGKQATVPTKNYVGEKGWICKLDANHAIDPLTGLNYRTEIANIITDQGFVNLPVGPIGGGVSGSDYCRLTTT